MDIVKNIIKNIVKISSFLSSFDDIHMEENEVCVWSFKNQKSFYKNNS